MSLSLLNCTLNLLESTGIFLNSSRLCLASAGQVDGVISPFSIIVFSVAHSSVACVNLKGSLPPFPFPWGNPALRTFIIRLVNVLLVDFMSVDVIDI